MRYRAEPCKALNRASRCPCLAGCAPCASCAPCRAQRAARLLLLVRRALAWQEYRERALDRALAFAGEGLAVVHPGLRSGELGPAPHELPGVARLVFLDLA